MTHASSADERSSGAEVVSLNLVSLLAHTTRLVDLLPPLHQHALDVTGGRCSLLFEHNPRNGVMQATSGFSLDAFLTDPWAPAPDEAAIVSEAFARGRPLVVTDADRDMPDLASRLRARAVLLLPLSRGGDRVGMVAIGFSGAAPSSLRNEVAPMADAFLMAIELTRLRQRDELQRDLRLLLDEFTQSLSATLQLPAGPRHLLPRRQASVRRRSHIGVDSRSPRAGARASGVNRFRAGGGRGADPRRRSAVAGGGRHAARTG